ncbi:MAG: 4-hydroxybenzoyl-CoA reductase subunit beta [Burkholderiales bacterium]|nr:4-hydroxybenzoyl-CoA reductase subunit beta [Burkholderiales bacterium]
MELLPAFSLQRPETAEEAARLLSGEAQARVLAGGTGLVANLRLGLAAPELLVSLERLAGMRDIGDEDGAVRFGAGVTLARLAADAKIAARFPALAQAAAAVAGPAHRSAATLGGNLCLDTRCVYYNQGESWRAANGYCLKYRGEICHVAPQGKRCHAAYSGDLAPALMVLGAEAQIAGPAGARRTPLADLYREDGARHLTLGRGEFLLALRVPVPAPGSRSGYRKSRARGAIDFPLAGVAAAVRMEGDKVRELRLALTGTNSCPLLLAGAGELAGQPLDAALLERVAKLVQRQASPQRTTVVSANYRRQVAAALAKRLVSELALKR